MLEVYYILVSNKARKLESLPDMYREEVKRKLEEAGITDYE